MISVIVPVYNVRKYISKCIESIMNQSYRDFELILVDDGSYDGSGEICDDYVKKDNRIKVIHQENCGLVNARKTGIRNAHGEFIYYVDGDDWIERTLLEDMYNEFIESEADILCMNHMLDFDGKLKVVCNTIPTGIYRESEIENQILSAITPYLWSKFTRKDVIYTYQLNVDDRIIAGEDVVVTFPVINNCKKIVISKICGYHYVQRNDSIMNIQNKNEFEKCELVIKYLNENLHIINKKEQLYKYKKKLYNTRMPYRTGVLKNLEKEDRVVIYGAGYFGRALYRYIINNKIATVVSWLDRDYQYMSSIGLPVTSPENFDYVNTKYDCCIIALTDIELSNSVETFLKERGAKNCVKINE